MQLTQEALDEFKEIYRQDYGITLTNEQALELAISFFSLMRAVYKPLPKCHCEEDKEMI